MRLAVRGADQGQPDSEMAILPRARHEEEVMKGSIFVVWFFHFHEELLGILKRRQFAMKKLVALMVACLFLVSVMGIVMAAEQAAPSAKTEKPAAAAPAKPAEKAPAKHGKEAPKTMTGAVKSVDIAANSIMIEKKGKEASVKVTDKTKFMGVKGLAELAAGDKVTVKYTEKEGQKVAASVKKVTEMKKAKPVEPAKPTAPAQPMAPAQK